MKYLKICLSVMPVFLSGCAYLPSEDSKEPPMAFHDTRLQYALVAGNRETLAHDFHMKLQPSMVERVVAGTVLPFTAASEAAFWPFLTGIKSLSPPQQHDISPQ